jgi:peptide/nickel transport system substrate-binding protein
VVFTFAALYDPVAKTDVAESLVIDGKPIAVSAPDKHTVVLKFPAPYGPGIALLDSLPILPRHKLAAAVTAGTFRAAWGLDTPVADLAGLGPFVIREYKRGERLVFARNPHYWRADDAGVKLPYLDEIEVQFVADQNTGVLRLQAGESDLLTDLIRAEDVASFRKAMATGQVGLVDAGISVSPDWLVFNLVPGAAVAAKRPWLQRDELRQAVSYAVDRQALVDTVYLGAAVPVFGPITPGHGEWYLADGPRTDYDQARARTLLATIGLRDRDGDGTVDDADYVVWKSNFGATNGVGLAADGNENNVVDAADFIVWRNNFGRSVHNPGGGGTGAPEPAAIVLFGQMIGLLLLRGTRRAKQ